MDYIITGGKKLSGTIEVAGAKNAALKLMVASLLCSGRTVLHNVPRIRDVEALVDIVNYLGGEAKFIAENTLSIENKLTKNRIPLEIAGKTRVSFLLIAPLLFTFGKAIIPNPGGCRLGKRPVDRLVKVVEEFGAKVKYNSEDGFYYASLDKAKAFEFSFSKKTQVVFGSRRLNKNNKYSTRMYYWGGVLLDTIISKVLKIHVTDAITGSKIFTREVYEKIKPIESKGFEVEAEITAKIIKKGFKLTEVPITYTPRTVKEGKNIRWHHGFIILKTLITIAYFRK